MTILTFISLTGCGLIVGVISSFFGIGGGAFLVPMLVGVAGLSWPVANGLSLTQMVPMSILGAWRRTRQREVDVRLALMTLTGSIPGAWLGSRIVGWLGKWGTIEMGSLQINILDAMLRLFFIGFLGFMASKMLRDDGSPEPAKEGGFTAPVIRPWRATLLGLEVGLTSGLLGIGGGFLFVPIAIRSFGFPVAVAVGTSLFQMPFTAASGAASYILDQKAELPYLWLIPLLVGSLSGVMLGISLSRRISNRQYRKLLGGMLLAVSVLFLAQGALKIVGGGDSGPKSGATPAEKRVQVGPQPADKH